MKERIVIPTEDRGTLNGRISEHFGRSPHFTIVEIDENGDVLNIQVVSNLSEHFGGPGRPSDEILRLQPNAVIVYGMGPKALSILQQAGVAVLKTDAGSVKEAIEAYREGRLQELTEGCRYSRHR
ncbi:MAG: NifB/NifX family molybdenum-iron cluster-binding protein [Candidatus Bathyarchaeia archaeon]